MAHATPYAMALASPTPFVDVPKARDVGDHSGTANFEKLAHALLTPPTSTSPELAAHSVHDSVMSPPLITIERQEMDMREDPSACSLDNASVQSGSGVPLSRNALSDLDGAQAITPSMLAKHHLPGIMLGNGPRPIRYVMGELTQTVPGFSRIPPTKARRIVVAALESRTGGGPDGNITFCKTGWGRWDAHVKGSSRDSGIGSFNDGHMSPPRSERSYAMSHTDSGVHIRGPRLPSKYRDTSGASHTASNSFREEDEFDMDMDVLEEAADKMSMDGDSETSSELDDATDDEDWAAVGIDALRKASMPHPDVPRLNYRAVSIPYNGPWTSKSWTRRPSQATTNDGFLHSFSVPSASAFAPKTPEENAAFALMSLGSM